MLLQIVNDRGDSVEATFLVRYLWTAREESKLGEVSFFPRRGSNLVLRLLDPRYQLVAEFRAPNPAFADYPELPAESLPATREDGDLAVTLEAFATGWSNGAADEASAPKRYPRRRSTLTLRLREHGEPTQAWAVRSLRLSDGTGNRWTTSRPDMQPVLTADGRFEVEPSMAVWETEPGWEVDVEFLRIRNFGTADVVEIPPLPIPATNQVMELDTDYRLGGHIVRLRSLSGPQPKSISEDNRPAGRHVLRVETPGMGSDWRPGLISVRDDRERDWRVLDYQRNGRRTAYYLEGFPDARTLTLTLARQEIRRARFTARATLARPE